MPAGLPHHCPQCAKPLHIWLNLHTGLGKTARLFRTLGLLGGPGGFSVLMFFAWLSDDRNAEGALGHNLRFRLIVALLAPVFLFEGIALLLPKVRILTCHSCRWTQDYPFPKKQ